MEKILSITRKLGISFYALLSAAASSKFIQSTKVVLINFCALGAVKRIFLVFKWIGKGLLYSIAIPLGLTAFFIWLFGSIAFGIFLCLLEIILLIPYGLWWVATGEFHSWKIATFFWNTKIFIFLNEEVA